RQQAVAVRAQTTTLPHVKMPSGEAPPDDPLSPVLLVGHSYVTYFREQLIRELNLLVRTVTGAGQTTDFFGDLVREPERLDGVRVVIWVTTEQHLTQFKPLPPSVAAAGFGPADD